MGIDFSQLMQLGAIGAVAGILLWQSIRRERELSVSLDKNQNQLVQLVRANTEVMRSLKDALDRRPCLAGDESLQSPADSDR